MQDTGNGSGQGWDKRAFSAQVAEWAIAVGDETGASVAHPARPLRRGVGGLAGAEHAHYRLKDAIDQALILRGSLDFDTADDYAGFVRQLVGRRNRLAEGKLSRRCFAYVPCRLIGSLVRKPGAFARYRFREQLFPTMHFRLTYDALREWRGDVEYVRILHLALSTMEATVDSALSSLQPAGGAFVGLSLIYRSRGSRRSSSFVRPAI